MPKIMRHASWYFYPSAIKSDYNSFLAIKGIFHVNCVLMPNITVTNCRKYTDGGMLSGLTVKGEIQVYY